MAAHIVDPDMDKPKEPDNRSTARKIFDGTVATVVGAGVIVGGFFGMVGISNGINAMKGLDDLQDCATNATTPFGDQLAPKSDQIHHARQHNDGLIPLCPAEKVGSNGPNRGGYSFDASDNQAQPTVFLDVSEGAMQGANGKWITAEQAVQQGRELSYQIGDGTPSPSSLPSSLTGDSKATATRQVEIPSSVTAGLNVVGQGKSSGNLSAPATPSAKSAPVVSKGRA